MDSPLFDYTSSATGPIAEGNAPRYYGPFNTGMQGFSGLALQLLGMQLQGMMSQHGMLPAQFMPMQTLYDQQRAATFFQGQQQAMQFAAKADQHTYQDILHGWSNMTGSRWDERAQQTAATMAKDFSALTPIFAQLFPELVDAVHGSRGSAVVMAQRMHRAGQHAIDPITGRVGLSATSAGTLAEEIFNQRFGPGANLAEMRGMTAGQSGALYDELLQRGQLGPSIGRFDRQQQIESLAQTHLSDDEINRIAERSGKSPSAIRQTQRQLQTMQVEGPLTDLKQLDKMAGLDDMMRSFDAHKIGDRLRNLSGAVSAMRDIFGDEGRPNAPMREIIAGLEHLTQSNLANSSPAEMELMVRQTQALARGTGVSMTTVAGLTAHTAALTDRLGLDRSFAAQATQGALAFGGGVNDAGRLDIPTYSSLSKDELILLDKQLRTHAAASPIVNQMNAVLRMVDEGIITDENSPAAKYAAAIKSGQTTFEYQGQQVSVGLNQGAMMQLLSESGVNTFTAQSFLRAPHANQEYGARYRTQDVGRQLQAEIDALPIFKYGFGGAIGGVLDSLGRGSPETLKASRAAGYKVAQAVLAMPEDIYRDTDKRNAAIARHIKSALAEQGQVVTDAEALQMATAGWGQVDQVIRSRPETAGYGGAIGVLQAQSKQIMGAAQARAADARTEADLQRSLSGIGRAGPLRRLVDTVMDSNRGDDFGKVMAKLAGSIDIETIDKNDPVLREFVQQQMNFRDAEVFHATLKPEEVDAAVAQRLGQAAPTTEAERTTLRAHPEYASHKQAVEDEARHKSGQLTPRGIEQRERAARMVEALTSGGDVAVRQLDWIAKSLQLKGSDAITAEAIAAQRPKWSDAQRESLLQTVNVLREARRGGGVVQRREQAGYVVGAQVTQEDIGTLQERGKHALELQGRTRGTTGKDFEAARDYLRGYLQNSRETAGTLLLDKNSMLQLGAGGVDLMQGIEATDRELQVLAKEAGVSVEELLAGKGPPDKVAAARKLQKTLGKAWDDVGRRQGVGKRPTGKDALTEYEQAQLEKEREFRIRSGSPEEIKHAQAQYLAKHLIDMAPKSQRRKLLAQQEKIVASIESGNRQLPVFRAVQAREDMVHLAATAGLLTADDGKTVIDESEATAERKQQAVERLLRGEGKLNAAQQHDLARMRKQSSLLKNYGRSTVDDMVRQLDQIKATDGAAGGPGAGSVAGDGKMQGKITGELTLKGLDKALLAGQLAITDIDHGPVMNVA